MGGGWNGMERLCNRRGGGQREGWIRPGRGLQKVEEVFAIILKADMGWPRFVHAIEVVLI